VPVQEQVLRLQIAVDDIVRMQIIKCKRDLSGVELGNWVGKALLESVGRWGAGSGELTWDLRSRLNSSPPSTKSMTM
jgi:hypothetical protein